MAAERTFKLRFVGDQKSAEAAFKGAGAAAEGFSGKVTGLGKHLGDVAKIAGGFVLGQGLLKLPGLLGGSMNAASNFNETLSKSNTIFREQGDEIAKWANTAAKSFGQSRTQALDAAGTFGNMFTQLGIGADTAAAMSMQMTELASDFASFHNADISDVLSAQTAAFRGEYDAVQRFVPTINAAAVEQKALEMGLAKTTKELTAQDKALATQKLLYEGAGAALGDFGRTAEGAANKQRILDARLADLSVTIGTKLLPVKVALLGLMLDRVIPAFEKLWGVVEARVLPAVQEFAVDAIPVLIEALTSLLRGFNSTVDGIVGGVNALTTAFTVTLTGILDVVSTVGMAIYEALQWLNPFAEHSPSLVSQVEAGAAAIIAAYALMAGATANLEAAGGAVEGLGAAFADMNAQVEAVADAKTLEAISAIGGATAVTAYEGATAAVEELGRAYEELGPQIETAKTAVDATKTALDEAKRAYQEFAGAALAESEPFNKAAKDLEYQIAAVELSINKLKQAGPLEVEVEAGTGKLDKLGNEITKTTKELTPAGQAVEDLETKLEALRLKAEQVQLEEKIQVGPLEDQIDDLTNTTKKLTFKEIIEGLKSSKAEIGRLEPVYAGQQRDLETLQSRYQDIGEELKTFQSTISTTVQAAVREFDALNKSAGGAGGGGAGGAAAAIQGFNEKVGEATGPGGTFSLAADKLKEISDNFTELKQTMTETKEKLTPLVEKVQELAKWFATNKDLLVSLGAVMAVYLGVVLALQVAIIAVNAATAIFVGVQYALAAATAVVNAIMALNPFVLVAIAVAALVAGIYLLIKHWDTIVEKVPFLKTALEAVTGFVTDTVVPVITSIWEKGLKPVIDFVTDHWQLLAFIIAAPFMAIYLLATDAFGIRSAIVGAFDAVWEKISGWGEDVLGFFTDLPGKLKSGFGAGFDFLWDAFKGAINQIIRAWNGLEFSIPKVSNPFGPGSIGGGSIGTPDIPELARGTSFFGGGLAIVGEQGPELVGLPRGSQVIPARETAGMLGGGGVTLSATFHIQGNADEGVLRKALETWWREKLAFEFGPGALQWGVR